jgi:Secretion system C-terminal sorting domain
LSGGCKTGFFVRFLFIPDTLQVLKLLHSFDIKTNYKSYINIKFNSVKKLLIALALILTITVSKAQTGQYPYCVNYGSFGDFFYLVELNNNPTIQGATAVNSAAVVVKLDTLFGFWDYSWPSNSYDMRGMESFYIDSVYTFVKHKNYSGLTDTIIMQYYNTDVNGLPDESSIIWSDTIFTNQSLTPDTFWGICVDNTFDYSLFYDTLTRISFTTPLFINQPNFAIAVKYYGSPLDTFELLASSKIGFQTQFNFQSRYNNTFVRAYPTLPDWTPTSSIGLGNPAGSQGWFMAQDWHIGLHICETKAQPNEESEFCMITADSTGLYYEFIWEKGTSGTIATYEIEEDILNDYYGYFSNTIQTQPYQQFSTYTHNSILPSTNLASYRLASKNANGDLLHVSAIHIPIYITMEDSLGHASFNYTPYVGFPYTKYFVYRGLTPNNMALYDSLFVPTTNKYTDSEANSYGVYYYQIEAVRQTPCTPSKATQQMGARSVCQRFAPTGVAQQQALLNSIVLYPNPAQNTLNINLGKVSNEGVTIQIFNTVGQAMKLPTFTANDGTTFTMDVSSLPNGLYFAHVQAFGGVKIFKVVKE